MTEQGLLTISNSAQASRTAHHPSCGKHLALLAHSSLAACLWVAAALLAGVRSWGSALCRVQGCSTGQPCWVRWGQGHATQTRSLTVQELLL